MNITYTIFVNKDGIKIFLWFIFLPISIVYVVIGFYLCFFYFIYFWFLCIYKRLYYHYYKFFYEHVFIEPMRYSNLKIIKPNLKHLFMFVIKSHLWETARKVGFYLFYNHLAFLMELREFKITQIIYICGYHIFKKSRLFLFSLPYIIITVNVDLAENFAFLIKGGYLNYQTLRALIVLNWSTSAFFSLDKFMKEYNVRLHLKEIKLKGSDWDDFLQN